METGLLIKVHSKLAGLTTILEMALTNKTLRDEVFDNEEFRVFIGEARKTSDELAAFIYPKG